MPEVVTQGKWIPIAFLCFLLQAVGFSPAQAFSLIGFQDLTNPVAWSDAALQGGITFSIAPNFHTLGSGDPSQAIRNAFGTWSENSVGVSFREAGTVRLSPYAGAQIDVFAMPSTFTYGGYALDGALALAVVGTYQGEILGADIYFNRGYAWSDNPGPNQFDIHSVALHEIGHTLGLDDTDDAANLGRNYDALGNPIPATGLEVMHSFMAPGEVSRVLTDDELAGLAFLYPSSSSMSGGTIFVSPQNPAPVPEPSTVMLLVSGLFALFSAMRRNSWRVFFPA